MKASNQPEIYDDMIQRRLVLHWLASIEDQLGRGRSPPPPPPPPPRNATDVEGEGEGEGDGEQQHGAVEDCVVNIHGFHSAHRLEAQALLVAEFPGAATTLRFNDTAGNPLDEGQHGQPVYASFRDRSQLVCGFSGNPRRGNSHDMLYTCEGNLWSLDDAAVDRLRAAWRAAWDDARPLKLQTSPTFDVLLLNRALDSAEVLIMRHPLAPFAHLPQRHSLVFALDTWVRVWTRLFQQLRYGLVSRWIVFQYDGQDGQHAGQALFEWTRAACAPALRRTDASAGSSPAPAVRPAAGDLDDAMWAREVEKESSKRLRAVVDLWEPLLDRWFGYSLATNATRGVEEPAVFASHLDNRTLVSHEFLHDWDLAFARHLVLLAKP